MTPRLIVTSHYSRDSRLLRHTAEKLGWETLRIDRSEMPDWLEPKPNTTTAIYGGIPTVFELAEKLRQVIFGFSPGWLASIPGNFLRRHMELSTAQAFLNGSRKMFVKPTCSKAFPAGIYAPSDLEPHLADLDAEFPIYVAEPVSWDMEFRAFICQGAVATLNAYRYQGRYLTRYDQPFKVSARHQEAAKAYVRKFLAAYAEQSPPAFVLDVGYISKRGWAVVEGNEACASGLYTCDPAAVLQVLLQATIPQARLTDDLRRFDCAPHYYDSFARRRGHPAKLPATGVAPTKKTKISRQTLA